MCDVCIGDAGQLQLTHPVAAGAVVLIEPGIGTQHVGVNVDVDADVFARECVTIRQLASAGARGAALGQGKFKTAVTCCKELSDCPNRVARGQASMGSTHLAFLHELFGAGSPWVNTVSAMTAEQVRHPVIERGSEPRTLDDLKTRACTQRLPSLVGTFPLFARARSAPLSSTSWKTDTDINCGPVVFVHETLGMCVALVALRRIEAGMTARMPSFGAGTALERPVCRRAAPHGKCGASCGAR